MKVPSGQTFFQIFYLISNSSYCDSDTINNWFFRIVVELFTPRIGFAGIIGVSAFLLYFYGHIVSGLAGIGHFFICCRNYSYFIRISFTREESSVFLDLLPYWLVFSIRRKFCSYWHFFIDCFFYFNSSLYGDDKGV